MGLFLTVSLYLILIHCGLVWIALVHCVSSFKCFDETLGPLCLLVVTHRSRNLSF